MYREACAITDQESTILTGGRDTLNVVARYNLQVSNNEYTHYPHYYLSRQPICHFIWFYHKLVAIGFMLCIKL